MRCWLVILLFTMMVRIIYNTSEIVILHSENNMRLGKLIVEWILTCFLLHRCCWHIPKDSQWQSAVSWAFFKKVLLLFVQGFNQLNIFCCKVCVLHNHVSLQI